MVVFVNCIFVMIMMWIGDGIGVDGFCLFDVEVW